MKKSLLLVVALVFASVTLAIAVDNGPAKINLKEEWKPDSNTQKSVIFDHEFHQTNNTCTECHDTDAGGKFRPAGDMKGLNDKNVPHAFCWPCHTEKNVSVKKTCTKCHIGPK